MVFPLHNDLDIAQFQLVVDVELFNDWAILLPVV